MKSSIFYPKKEISLHELIFWTLVHHFQLFWIIRPKNTEKYVILVKEYDKCYKIFILDLTCLHKSRGSSFVLFRRQSQSMNLVRLSHSITSTYTTFFLLKLIFHKNLHVQVDVTL